MITLTAEEVELCKTFSEQVDTSFYAKRNQFSEEKRIKDSFIGKMGEIVVYKYFKEKGIELSYPDTKIYNKKDKSWAPDLSNSEYNVHVKTQDLESGKRYGVSWMFQAGSSFGHKDKEIHNPSDKDYLALVSLDFNSKSGEIKAVFPVKDAHQDKLFKEPKLDKLKGNKVAIYFDDLKADYVKL